MTIDLKELGIPKVPKVEAKKGDFPLEIRVSYDRSGNVTNVSSIGGRICPEELDEENIPDWNIFNGAPEKIKFGDDYQRIATEELDGLKRVRYVNITKYP